MAYFVYILASRTRGTLYVGVTNDIARRVYEHKEGVGAEFTKSHGIDRLVYYETFDGVSDAIAREKQLKRWRRAWKIKAIEDLNPDWNDLYVTLNG
ncbi:GIY-YIG nuclease family protein [Stappia stellulata]|uniref:GIY-YIG nuclease family protein n=1 Tax=Stappia TaxID=152161 RepID=UPI001CD2B5C5|nr:GIY-YIG nuclease family protein [Stappia stellulata]MCA1244921.1 GIY-YIG nuclease family protein [Stappia stellulata]